MNVATGSSESPLSLIPEGLSLDKTKGLQAIRAALLMLVLLTAAAIHGTWDTLQNLSHHLGAIPLLLFVVICIFVVMVYAKAQEMAGLRGVVQTLQSQQAVLGSELEAQKLLQTVAASRESFRDLVDSFDSAVFTLSLEGNVRAANKAFVAVLNQPFSEVIGKSIFELVSEPSAKQLQQALPTFLEKRQWSGLVRVCIAATGQWRFFDCVLHPVLQDGDVLAITIIAKDVTAEREREKTFSVLFETLHESVWVTTCEGRLLDSNRSLSALVGADGKTLLNENLLESVLEPERQRISEAMRTRQIIRDLELTLVRADGSRAFCIANATPVIEVSGATRYHGTFTDITQRRSMERRLACEQKFREQLIASFPDAIITVDAVGRITFVSGRAERLFGKPADSLLNSSLIDLIDPQDEMALHTFLQDCLSLPETACTHELRLRSLNAPPFSTIEATGTALQDADHNTLGIVASIRDVTNQKEIERHMVASERMSMLGEMTRGAFHELNNALTTVFGVCSLMKDEKPSLGSQKKLDLLTGQAARVRETVHNLLVFAQPSTTTVVAVDVGDLMDRAIALRRYSLHGNHVSIDLQTDPDLPAVIGDPAQLVQVFINLLANAEASCIAKGIHVETVRIRLGVLESSVWCTVAADVSGVELDPGTPGQAESRPYDTDVGLKVARAIVRAHGGKIEVSTETAKLPTFRVSLPALVEKTCKLPGRFLVSK